MTAQPQVGRFKPLPSLALKPGVLFAIVVLAAATVWIADGVSADGPADENPPTVGLMERVRQLEEKVADHSTGFSIGAVIFSLKDAPPGPNWVRCDGTTTFPDDAPEALRGKQVPNLQNALIAVGDWNNPRIDGSLSEQVVDGSSFSLPATSTKQIAAGAGNVTNPSFKGGLVAVFQANGDYLGVQHSTAHWGCFGGQMNVTQAVYEHHPAGATLNGSVRVLPPTHAYLQAYVRIR